jgi:putative membrane-bound dehydrogenase-like protein
MIRSFLALGPVLLWVGALLTALPLFDKDSPPSSLRVPPREPAQALESFQVRPGFRIELVASEPLLRSPVALDFDEDGRLFVAEFPEYNQYATGEVKDKGCIRLLEDSDGDGRMDRSTRYVDNLNSPVAVACYDGGVFVGVVPDLLYCKDTDGDGKADLRQRIFTGFARDRAGEAMLNSFRWGLDNRFHVSTSMAGGEVQRVGDKGPAVSARGQGFIFDPRTYSFTLTSGGGQHGMSMDDWGRKFVCSNSDPAQLLIYDSQYLARNPQVAAPKPAVSIAPGGKYTKLFRISPDEPWRVLRTRLRVEGKVKGPVENGTPSGFFTGASGVTIYRGHAWPTQYRGNLFVGEVANNLIHRARLEPRGVSLVARRADRDREFLASTDRWFRPVQFANGPDGNLYVLDMYRELIEGAAFLPSEVLKQLDVHAGVNRGRIYRIVPKDYKYTPPPKLSKASTEELVNLLEHPNGWHRDSAARLLYQRQDRSAIPLLRKLQRESRTPLGRLHALYALAGLEALRVDDVLLGLGDKHWGVRQHALRLAEAMAGDPRLQSKVLQLVEDPDVRVRYQLAFSLGAFQTDSALEALAALARRDGADPWFQLAVRISVPGRAAALLHRLSRDRTYRGSEHGQALLRALAAQVSSAQQTDEIAEVVKAVEELPEAEGKLAQMIVQSLVSKLSGEQRRQVGGAAGGRAQAILTDLLRRARVTALDREQPPDRRAEAVRTLGLGELADSQALLSRLLDPRQPEPVQRAVVETLGRFDHAEVPNLILRAWPSFSPRVRATATEVLLSRSGWVDAFFDAVAGGKVKPADLDPARVQLLQSSPDARVSKRARELFGKPQRGRAEVVAAYRQALLLKGDHERGKVVFRKNCSTCHRLEGEGQALGADLQAIRDRGTEAILLNILDPNREVKPRFLSYFLTTTRGRTLTGMITAETASSITLRRADGSGETVLRKDIEELSSSGLSFMPEGLEKQIKVQQMADLLAYLNSIR